MAAGRRKRNKKQNRLGVLAISFVATILVVVFGVQTWKLEQKDRLYEERLEQLRQEIAEEEAKGKELEAQQIYMKTKQYIEEMARRKFGLIKPGELLIKGDE